MCHVPLSARLSVLPSDRQSFHMEKTDSHLKVFHQTWPLIIFLKGLEKIQVASKSDKCTGHFMQGPTWSDKVRELATVCLPWQHWTKALVWFDDVDISMFHSCVVVDLWQSLSEWHLLLSACVLVCRRENVGA